MNDRNPRRNSEYYPDLTAYEAIKRTDPDDDRFHKLLNTIFYMCEIAGFELGERIVLVDKTNGHIWR